MLQCGDIQVDLLVKPTQYRQQIPGGRFAVICIFAFGNRDYPHNPTGKSRRENGCDFRRSFRHAINPNLVVNDTLSESPPKSSPMSRSLLSTARHHLETIYLFTRSDYKTIFFPVTIFAAVAAPYSGVRPLVDTLVWIWFHLLQANVSNQTFSGDQDILNKPWRPLPSNRVTVRQARILRWLLMFWCLFLSSFFGPRVVAASAALTLVEIVHDDFDLSGHPILKNLCNVGGYSTFELGATLVLSPTRSLDKTACIALVSSTLIIFTTIHAQDFADVEGDKLSGRRTIPIIAPEGSRVSILAALLVWSGILAALWGLGPVSAAMFFGMGGFVGARYFRFRDVQNDKRSYLLYNIWLVVAHILPANARLRALIW
ncbi:hypothetical protein AX16_009067 [Volvariella volvacea WC 439]|nr:hypothetical protein AX16_009067 [Volvariella volvacea WC 439]